MYSSIRSFIFELSLWKGKNNLSKISMTTAMNQVFPSYYWLEKLNQILLRVLLNLKALDFILLGSYYFTSIYSLSIFTRDHFSMFLLFIPLGVNPYLSLSLYLFLFLFPSIFIYFLLIISPFCALFPISLNPKVYYSFYCVFYVFYSFYLNVNHSDFSFSFFLLICFYFFISIFISISISIFIYIMSIYFC